jgi:hypothetical protein
MERSATSVADGPININRVDVKPKNTPTPPIMALKASLKLDKISAVGSIRRFIKFCHTMIPGVLLPISKAGIPFPEVLCKDDWGK